MISTLLESARGMPQDDDVRLIERFLEGDHDAFQQLYAKYFDKVFAISRGILIDHDDASDAVQEIFTQVYRHLKHFDRRSKFSTWLFRIAVNRSIQQARRTKYRSRLTDLNEASGQIAPETIHEADPKIEAAMSKLSPEDRAILSLFYWEEFSIQEIAASIGCKENAAKTRLYRARERFRSHFEADE